MPNTKNKKWIIAVIGSISAIVITTFFGIVFFNDHAWGAWGDDSPGYVYLAARMYEGKDLIYTDELAYQGYLFFNDEKLARWLTPTHHDFINTNGVVASRYPLGLSLIMYAVAVLFASTKAFYVVIPALATLNILLTYLLSVQLFKNHSHRYVIATFASISLGMTSLYYTYALSQPMREIPSITFLLLSALSLVLLNNDRILSASKRLQWILYTIGAGLASFFFGMAVNIRETSLVVLPALFIYVLYLFFGKHMRSNSNHADSVRTTTLFVTNVTVFVIILCITLIPTIYNSYQLSNEKEVFKQRDTSEVVLLSNIDHIQTISFSNIFGSEGKYKPNKGSLPQYWEVLQDVYPISYFLLFVLFGVILGFKHYRKETILLLVWISGTLLIFSMWINPYSRYILPLFPPLLILGAYGFTELAITLQRAIFQDSRVLQRISTVLVVVLCISAYVPGVMEMKDNVLYEDIYKNKAIAETDYDQLIAISSVIQNSDSQQPLVVFAGNWQYGISETFESHTGIKSIRYPLEQKFLFDESQVTNFFDNYILNTYDVYVWVDPSVSSEYYQWVQSLSPQLLLEQDYTFQEEVQIYKLQ